MVSIKEYITPNIPFKSSVPLLVIFIVFCNVAVGDTWQVLLIGSYRVCSDNRNECVMKI